MIRKEDVGGVKANGVNKSMRNMSGNGVRRGSGDSNSGRRASTVNQGVKRISVTLFNAVDNAMSRLSEEEVEAAAADSDQRSNKRDSVLEDINEQVEKAVVDTSEFRNLQAQMRATGMTTGIGTKEFLLNRAEERRSEEFEKEDKP